MMTTMQAQAPPAAAHKTVFDVDLKRFREHKVGVESHPEPFVLQDFIDSKVAAGEKNFEIYGTNAEFKIYISGEKIKSTDFLTCPHEEWFLQMKGSATITIVDEGVFKTFVLKEGDNYLVPKKVPHCIQRKGSEEEESRTLVVSRSLEALGEEELRMYCPGCSSVMHRRSFRMRNFDQERRDFFSQFLALSDEERTCKQCGKVSDGSEAPTAAIPAEEKDTSVGAIDEGIYPQPFNFMNWIEENKVNFKPPVGNKMVYGGRCDFKVMCVGGPNCRSDYHFEEGEEWFYMVKGEMNLKILDNGRFRDVIIKEGESFLLPAYVYHSPQRGKDSIGLVIERERLQSETDRLSWFCRGDACQGEGKDPSLIYEERFYCDDLGKDLVPVIKRYYGSDELRTCRKCAMIDLPPVLKD
eukprot:Nk52_evm1s2038 gene=Nk52_evmTU1s2038